MTFLFIPAAALAAGAQAPSSRPDVDLNNAGTTAAQFNFIWLPRGEDNSNLDPLTSDSVHPSSGRERPLRNVLNAVFGAEPDAVGALAVSANSPDLLAMSGPTTSRAPRSPAPSARSCRGIPADMMIATVREAVIFMNENDDVRANVGCQNGVNTRSWSSSSSTAATAPLLETKYMTLGRGRTTRSTASSATTRRSTATSTSSPTRRTRRSTATARCSTT